MLRLFEQPRLQESSETAGGGGTVFENEKRNKKRDEAIRSLISEGDARALLDDPERLEREIQTTKERLFDFLETQCSLEEDISKSLRDFFSSESGKDDLEELTLIRFYGNSYRPDSQKNEHPFREELFRHSLGVLRLVAEAYPKLLFLRAGGGEAAFALDGTISIKETVEKELGGMSPMDAYLEIVRAALVHDAGKVSLPEFVVYNSVTDKESLSLLKEISDTKKIDAVFKQFNQDSDFPFKHKEVFSEEERREVFEWLESCFAQGKGKRISPKMPVGVLVDADIEKSETIPPEGIFLQREGKLKEAHIDPNDSLGTVLDQHEMRSGIMIDALQHDPILVSFAAHHHNKEDKPLPSMITASTLLHISDVFEALTAERSYKKSMSLEQALAILVEESTHKHLNSKVIAAFIDLQIQKAFGGSSALDRRDRWRSINASERFKKIVEDFLIREGVWIDS